MRLIIQFKSLILFLFFISEATTQGQINNMSSGKAASYSRSSQNLPVQKLSFVFVPGGSFEMGDLWCDGFNEDEKPAHVVNLSSFWMSQYEVTNAQFCQFLNEMGNPIEGGVSWIDLEDHDSLIKKKGNIFVPKKGYDNHPVVEVSWYGARAFAKWMRGRLPTEAEWEYAARGGGKNLKYPNGNRLTFNDANISGTGYNDQWEKTSPVGSFPPNDLGLFDMSGNVWERCADWYREDYYKESPTENPKGAAEGLYKAMRGGSWDYSPMNCRTVTRGFYKMLETTDDIGFRIVRDTK